jgi:hypothetical protein
MSLCMFSDNNIPVHWVTDKYCVHNLYALVSRYLLRLNAHKCSEQSNKISGCVLAIPSSFEVAWCNKEVYSIPSWESPIISQTPFMIGLCGRSVRSEGRLWILICNSRLMSTSSGHLLSLVVLYVYRKRRSWSMQSVQILYNFCARPQAWFHPRWSQHWMRRNWCGYGVMHRETPRVILPRHWRAY